MRHKANRPSKNVVTAPCPSSRRSPRLISLLTSCDHAPARPCTGTPTGPPCTHLHPGSGGKGGADTHLAPLAGTCKRGFRPVNFLRQFLAVGKWKSLPELEGGSQVRRFGHGSSHTSKAAKGGSQCTPLKGARLKSDTCTGAWCHPGSVLMPL